LKQAELPPFCATGFALAIWRYAIQGCAEKIKADRDAGWLSQQSDIQEPKSYFARNELARSRIIHSVETLEKEAKNVRLQSS
jgi:hypothetical protein